MIGVVCGWMPSRPAPESTGSRPSKQQISETAARLRTNLLLERHLADVSSQQILQINRPTQSQLGTGRPSGKPKTRHPIRASVTTVRPAADSLHPSPNLGLERPGNPNAGHSIGTPATNVQAGRRFAAPETGEAFCGVSTQQILASQPARQSQLGIGKTSSEPKTQHPTRASATTARPVGGFPASQSQLGTGKTRQPKRRIFNPDLGDNCPAATESRHPSLNLGLERCFGATRPIRLTQRASSPVRRQSYKLQKFIMSLEGESWRNS
jgi:hypothetical protein